VRLTGRQRSEAAYVRHRERAASRQKQIALSGREISGEYPGIKNRRLRRKALGNFSFFCRRYFPDVFYLRFSDDHKRVIAKIESAVVEGGQFAMAMPRGSGKSALCSAACLWAGFRGIHRYILFVGATEKDATDRLDGIRKHLETNDILLDDFADVCYPIRRLDGIAQRRLLWHGQLIRMELKERLIVFPSLPDGPAAGVAIGVAGLTGRIRGRSHTRHDGQEVRPSLVFLDDPQDDESAHSPAQVAKREEIINGAVLGLAGPDKPISAVMPCTVIAHDDLAARVLSRQRNPQWRGELTKLIYEWPSSPEAETKWSEYSEFRRNLMRTGADPREVTQACNHFVEKYHDLLHSGAVVAWPDRHPGAISALQYAWNVRLDRGDAAFLAEYQNEPLKPLTDEQQPITPEIVLARLNRLPRGTVPAPSTVLTAFLDCSKEVLYWLVAAWQEGFSGAIVDYGTYPDQGRAYFPHSDVRKTLQQELRTGGEEAQLFHGLQRATNYLLQRDFPIDGGGSMRIRRLIIDAGWQTDTVFSFARQSPFAAIINASIGRFVGVTRGWLSPANPAKGETAGEASKFSPAVRHRGLRYLQFDSNHWKSHAAARLLCPLGSPGALVLCGVAENEHRMLADHLSAEVRIQATAGSVTKDEWQQQPNRDNHWWDCLVGATLAASWERISLAETARAPRKERVPLSKMGK
jgi:hypothetical protein